MFLNQCKNQQISKSKILCLYINIRNFICLIVTHDQLVRFVIRSIAFNSYQATQKFHIRTEIVSMTRRHSEAFFAVKNSD